MPIKHYPTICFKRHLILYILCAAIINSGQGCKKVQPGPGPGYYTSKLNGSWTVIGQECDESYYGCGDVFQVFTPRVINNMQVLGMTGDTLRYTSTDDKTHIVLFKGSYSGYKFNSEETLLYNYADNAVIDTYYTSGYSGGYYGSSGIIQSSAYVTNPELKKYINEIAGIKTFSGTVYDTFEFRAHIDSNYSVNTAISFTTADELTLNYDKDILGLNKGQLHYKSFDASSQTIVFQTYCRREWGNDVTTLSYNYGTKKTIFQQQSSGFGMIKHLMFEQQ